MGFVMKLFGYRLQRDERGIRIFSRGWGEVAYIYAKIKGLGLSVEFPTDWHESPRAWITWSLGFVHGAFSFKWKTIYKDHGQCSGPRWGFQFFEDLLWIYHGNDTGYSKDWRKYRTTITMPWSWRFNRGVVTNPPAPYAFEYETRSGEIQPRVVIAYIEKRVAYRFWLPFRMVWNRVDVDFIYETGERCGSWKGGTYGISASLKKGEGVTEFLGRLQSKYDL